MKKIKFKLALISGISFVLAFSAVILAVNIILFHQIEQNASDSIYYYLSVENWEGTPHQAIYMPNIISLDKNYNVFPELYSVEQEQSAAAIAKWCSENRRFNELQHAVISGRTYYLTAISDSADEIYEIIVLYIDVSGEKLLIRSINAAVFAVMIVMGIAASLLGWLTGTQIEKNQTAQKKFFENTSHELKTPLTAIRGYAEGLMTGIIDDNRKAAEVILNETEKMTMLIDDILFSARLESGAVKLNKESVNIREKAEDCLLPLEGYIKKRGLNIELDIHGGSVAADPNQFEHALNNVLINSVKYAESRIVINYSDNKLTVWNDGCYLSDKDLKHIFDRFYIGKNGNTGIGLELTKEIAELHGWQMKVEKINDGIGFIFKFL